MKKNGRQIFRRRNGPVFLGKTSKLIKAENEMIEQFARIVFWRKMKKINEPIHVQFIFHFTPGQYLTKQGVKKKNIPDLSNLYQLPEDCLQKAGIIENDNLIESHDGSRRILSDRMALEITIRRFSHGEKKGLVVGV